MCTADRHGRGRFQLVIRLTGSGKPRSFGGLGKSGTFGVRWSVKGCPRGSLRGLDRRGVDRDGTHSVVPRKPSLEGETVILRFTNHPIIS